MLDICSDNSANRYLLGNQDATEVDKFDSLWSVDGQWFGGSDER